jgi:hypothetical protein
MLAHGRAQPNTHQEGLRGMTVNCHGQSTNTLEKLFFREPLFLAIAPREPIQFQNTVRPLIRGLTMIH